LEAVDHVHSHPDEILGGLLAFHGRFERRLADPPPGPGHPGRAAVGDRAQRVHGVEHDLREGPGLGDQRQPRGLGLVERLAEDLAPFLHPVLGV